MKTCDLKAVGVALVGVAGLALAGCAHNTKMNSAPAGASVQNTPACQNNQFLKRYGCSLDRVEQAAESDDPDAMYALGYMYYYGIGTVKDKDTAVVWIQRAAGMNQPLAIKAMKVIYHKSFKRQGQTTVAAKAEKAKRLPQLDKRSTGNQPYRQQFSQAKKQAIPQQIQKAKHMTVAKNVAVKPGESSNWVGATQPANGVVASHATGAATNPSKKHYTLQIMAAHNIDVIKKVLKQYDLGAKASYYHTYFQNNNWYVLIYGEFPSVSKAKHAIDVLPKGVQRMHPWVKSYRTVQKEILEKRVI